MQHSPSTTKLMRVDVRLCGQIPRDELSKHFGAPNILNTSCLAETNGSSTLHKIDDERRRRPTFVSIASSDALPVDHTMTIQAPTALVQFESATTMKHRGVLTEKQQLSHHNHAIPTAPVLDPPSWAVPAQGETRLEPIGDSLGRQSAVDLASKRAFRIGRSPSCDIQLMHATSSRRHAMLFHHANGACYIVDCGSAHGTFVNGKRISSPAVTGVVVPHKVRRGSLIRFGGPGAPTFVLKSFNFSLSEINCGEPADVSLLVRRNTRLNALGMTAAESVIQRQPLFDALTVARKRSFDSLSSRDTLDAEEPEFKRIRCSSPPVSPEFPMRLVSPDLPCVMASKQRRVTFSCEPPQAFYPILVTPEESGDEDNAEA